MKVLLAVLAGVIGVPLFLGGLFVAVMASSVDPTIAGEAQTQGFVDMGVLAIIVGIVSCCIAWLCLKQDDRRLPEEKVCPNCGCRIRAGFNTCKWCATEVK